MATEEVAALEVKTSTAAYSIDTSAGLLHFSARHTYCCGKLRERQLVLYREGPNGRLAKITDDADLGVPLANKLLDDFHLGEKPQLQTYSITYNDGPESRGLDITVSPHRRCTVLQGQPRLPVRVAFNEAVVVTDAESRTCHALLRTIKPDYLHCIKEVFKAGVSAEDMTEAFDYLESAEAAMGGARPDATGISDDHLLERFGELTVARALDLRRANEKEAQQAVDDLYS